MISHKNAASAVGGRTARACDNCIKKRARWYCSADDAFLCQSCDASVHSANPLSRRHERVRLKTSASPCKHAHELVVHAHRTKKPREFISSPSGTWHKGFVKKPRTPRNKKASDHASGNPFLIVPEVGGDEASNEENDRDEFLLYRVPAYDPSLDVELCNSKDGDSMVHGLIGERKAVDSIIGEKGPGVDHLENLQGFLQMDADLAEFAADVESLLGRGLDNESFGIEELGLVDCKDGGGDSKEYSLSSSHGEAEIKLEEEVTEIVDGARDGEIDLTNQTFELSFNYGSPSTCCEEEEGDQRATELEEVRDKKFVDGEGGNNNGAKKKRKMILSLDYEGVITAWDGQGSPWTSGNRPEFNPDDCWQDWTGLCGAEFQNGQFGEGGIYGGGHVGIGNTGREAKVSRYREKRRTRLFSKKIRYEVRKLNAEKRPRMKGRFVKRASSFVPSPFPSLAK